ncbi:MAG: hypothetical protein OXF77_00840 [Thaumarchaeota archaeon]|nr:hypothetical protein [Nitrososphaerota archaeon]
MYADIKQSITTNEVKKIFGNMKNAKTFLQKANLFSNLPKKAKAEMLYQTIALNWDYNNALKIIREMFKKTDKYNSGKNAYDRFKLLETEWRNLGLGEIKWPFSAGQFDNYIQQVNKQNNSGLSKDKEVKKNAVRFRRIKEINTCRNDFLEYLIFERHQNLIPTLTHQYGVDFFVDGIQYDQKVSKSPTAQFQKDFGSDAKGIKKAIKNPQLVAKYLYERQDENRFGDNPRLLIVYMKENISIDRVKQILQNTTFNNPLQINFQYPLDKKDKAKPCQYRTQCFVVLLH